MPQAKKKKKVTKKSALKALLKERPCSVCNGTKVHEVKRITFGNPGYIIVKEPCICSWPQHEKDTLY